MTFDIFGEEFSQTDLTEERKKPHLNFSEVDRHVSSGRALLKWERKGPLRVQYHCWTNSSKFFVASRSKFEYNSAKRRRSEVRRMLNGKIGANGHG